MKLTLSAGTMLLALLVAGCGDKKSESSLAAANGNKPIAAIPAPNGGDWTLDVAATPEGGFRMGNPDAPVKLVEYGSMTCSHCAAFSAEGVPSLVANYVKTGRVSYEMRNYVRDTADMAISLVARCGGPTPFFQLTEQIFATQADWFKKLNAMSKPDQERLSTMAPEQRSEILAKQAGMIDFAGLRGIPAAKAEACAADRAGLDRLVAINDEANKKYDLQGTPTFLINGEVVPNSASWETLEPALKAALG